MMFGKSIIYKIIFLLSFFVFALPADLLSYNDDSTHYELTKEVITFYAAVSGKDLSAEEREIIARGSVLEDTPPRWVNHFYDPIHNEPWLARYAGKISQGQAWRIAKTSLGINQTYTSKDWAQNESAQAGYAPYGGNRTWQRALYEYAHGNKQEALRTLGFVLHLIEDATVPDHTRGDTHWENSLSDDPGSPYEKWAEKLTRSSSLNIAQELVRQKSKPLPVNSLDQIFDEVAIYSNNNFFSEETVDNIRFKLPGFVYLGNNFFGKKDDSGQEIKLFYFDDEDPKNIIKTTDRIPILQDYWSHLSPLAVKAGAGIMDYFFKEAERIEKEQVQLEKPQTAKGFMMSPYGEVARAERTVRQGTELARAVGSTIKERIAETQALAAKSAEAVKGLVQKVAGRSQEVAVVNQGEVLGEVVTATTDSDTTPLPLLKEEGSFKAKLVSQSSANITLEPNGTQGLSVTYQNTGTATWPAQFGEGNVSLNLAGADSSPLYDSSGLTQKRPAAVGRDVNPSQTVELIFTVRAPSAPGAYQLALRPVAYQGGSFLLVGEAVGWNVSVQIKKVQEQMDPIAPAETTSPSTPHPTPLLGEERELSLPPPTIIPPPPPPSAPMFIIIHAPDQTPPTSSIAPLPATQATSTFSVSWQGSDNIHGAPKSYDIQYQAGAGPWVDWLTGTTATSTSFTGQDEKIYGFRSRARDNEGNISAYPSNAETTTYVNLSVPNAPTVTSHANNQIIYTASVTLSGAADAPDSVVITLNQTAVTATTTASGLGAWSQLFTLAAGTNTFSLRAVEADGDISTTTTFTLRTIGTDQAQLSSDTDQLWGWNNAGSYNAIAQTFVPTHSTISNVALEICRIGTVTNQVIRLEVHEGSAFGQGTQAAGWEYNVATQAQIDNINALVPLCGNFQLVTFGLNTQFSSGNTEPMPITPGNTYHFLFKSGNGNIYRAKYQSSGNVYASGEMGRRELATWSNVVGADLAFKTLGVP